MKQTSARVVIRWAIRLTVVSSVVLAVALIGTHIVGSASAMPVPFPAVSVGGQSGPMTGPDAGPSETGAAIPQPPLGSDRSSKSESDHTLTRADGILPDEVTVFDDEYPGIANLDPALLQALRRAATEASADGATFYVSSGWRSPAYQNQLLHQAVATYGSETEAARWVATAEKSLHVTGDAVDMDGAAAKAWLSKHGAKYGLCQIYQNEPWHYELRRQAINDGCPDRYADPTHDPRMR
jgi:hypothetical protein